MKMTYEAPVMDVEQFLANEFFAACGDVAGTAYKFECNAGEGYPYKGSGNVWVESNGVPGLQKEGYSEKFPFGYVRADRSLGGYHPCGKTHTASSEDDFLNGYYVSNATGEVEDVIIWTGRFRNDVHCTTNLDINSWEVEKS